MSKHKTNFSDGDFIGLIIFALAVWFLLPTSWTGPFLYETKYQIKSDQVHWNDKPADCDFLHAPLGEKGCHYKKSVIGFNAAGDVVMGIDLVYGTDTKTGKTIISFDKGKTWAWLPEDAPKTPDLKVKRVEIDWEKIMD